MVNRKPPITRTALRRKLPKPMSESRPELEQLATDHHSSFVPSLRRGQLRQERNLCRNQNQRGSSPVVGGMLTDHHSSFVLKVFGSRCWPCPEDAAPGGAGKSFLLWFLQRCRPCRGCTSIVGGMDFQKKRSNQNSAWLTPRVIHSSPINCDSIILCV